MYKAYSILTGFNYSQKHIVIAKNMAEAEKLFLEQYPNITIKEIKLDAEYVTLPKEIK